MKTHSLDHRHTHTRWNRDLPPALEIASGDSVELAMKDSSDGQVEPSWQTADLPRLDRDRIHSLTGPIFVQGAQPGDVLEIEVLALDHLGWGWTSLVPGLGLLPTRFPDPYLFVWKLDRDVTASLAPARIPLRPFCGIMGVAPTLPGEHRTRPPGPFGGNMDIRQMGVGTRLFLPIGVEGALFSAGDCHAAQGDGEVCINGIEMPARGRFRFTLHRDLTLTEPQALIPAQPASGPARVFVASRPDFWDAARTVVEQAVDHLIAAYAYTPADAYILCSVALDLKVSQCVNQPMVTLTGHLPLDLFVGERP